MWNFQDVFVTRKRSFISAFSIRMTLFKWLFVANFMILHLNQICFLEQGYVLCKTGILMKPMKNLVISVGSLWTRYSLKKKLCKRSHWYEPIDMALTRRCQLLHLKTTLFLTMKFNLVYIDQIYWFLTKENVSANLLNFLSIPLTFFAIGYGRCP